MQDRTEEANRLGRPGLSTLSEPSHPPVHPDLLAAALDLVSGGEATCRADIREYLQVSSSTASNIARVLIAQGRLIESGTITSTGGRPAVALRATIRPALIAVAELGTRHARVGLSAQGRDLTSTADVDIDLERGPHEVLTLIVSSWREMAAGLAKDFGSITRCALALPGPVRARDQALVTPARMPGWAGYDLHTLLVELAEVPAQVDNDARAGAIGETTVRANSSGHFIYVKAGSGLGASLIASGAPYPGAHGLAGDITHTSTGPGNTRSCPCGKVGCLETVASGAAIRRQLAEDGIHLATMRDLVVAAEQSTPAVTAALRQAGRDLGQALSPLVNFLNPDAVVLGGSLSSIGSFTASVRAALYDRCLPIFSEHLTIESARAGADAALLGLLHQARTESAQEIHV